MIIMTNPRTVCASAKELLKTGVDGQKVEEIFNEAKFAEWSLMEPAYGDAYLYILTALIQQKKIAETLKHYAKLKESVLPEYHEFAHQIMLNLCISLSKSRYRETTLKIAEAICDYSHLTTEQIGSELVKIAKMYFQQGVRENSLPALEIVITLINKILGYLLNNIAAMELYAYAVKALYLLEPKDFQLKKAAMTANAITFFNKLIELVKLEQNKEALSQYAFDCGIFASQIGATHYNDICNHLQIAYADAKLSDAEKLQVTYYLGEALRELGRYEEAIEYFEKIRDLKLPMISAEENASRLGAVYVQLGMKFKEKQQEHFQKAEQILSKILPPAENPKLAGFIDTQLGVLHRVQGKLPEAIEYFTKAIKINNSDKRALTELLALVKGSRRSSNSAPLSAASGMTLFSEEKQALKTKEEEASSSLVIDLANPKKTEKSIIAALNALNSTPVQKTPASSDESKAEVMVYIPAKYKVGELDKMTKANQLQYLYTKMMLAPQSTRIGGTTNRAELFNHIRSIPTVYSAGGANAYAILDVSLSPAKLQKLEGFKLYPEACSVSPLSLTSIDQVKQVHLVTENKGFICEAAPESSLVMKMR